MKKTSLVLLFIAAFSFISAEGNSFSNNLSGMPNVQPTFEKGDFVINAGIGLGRPPLGKTKLPPITLSGEYGLVEDLFTKDLNLGIGGIFGIQTYSHIHSVEVSISFAARAALHYPLVENFDVHAGFIIGFGTNPNRMLPGVYVGGRYYFADNLAAFIELGAGISNINAGLAFKF